ncbi:MAG: 3-oxoacyl-[acyl-carrier protein] reductase [Halieaceae bacterium]|jgi:3-oxoacyl-[acyl-carrier protein] reductase
MDLQLGGKTALITGSQRGTGEIIARTLAVEGVKVLVHSNEPNLEDNVADTIDHARAIYGDVRTEAGCDEVLAQILELVGGVDILINNYGAAEMNTWLDSSTQDWLDSYQLNVLSAVRLAQGLVPEMCTQGWGRIIQLGTIGSHQPNNIMPQYYAAKGALATMGVSLAKELSGTGITVNTVSPGLIHTAELETAYRARAAKKGWGDDWEGIVQHLVKEDYPNPCERIAAREEVADAVVFLCSPRAGFINGQNLRVDGGAVRYV